MNPRVESKRILTYATAGVNRNVRERARDIITKGLVTASSRYSLGKPLRLPFGLVYPTSRAGHSYYDLQIEGIGTKTLLAELSGKYRTIGIDAVAMVVNDVIRSGARPILLSDGIHIASSDRSKVNDLLAGVRLGARLSGCVLASGETGNVAEVMHEPLKQNSPPFDLMASCMGLAEKSELIKGDLSPGDSVIGLRSSGIHSNGLTLARRVLLRQWGGRYDTWERPDSFKRSIIDELLEPTRIYVDAFVEASRSTRLKAAIHITGDGFGKFKRLLTWQRRFKQHGPKLGLRFEGLTKMPDIFRLIYDASRTLGTPISLREMFLTFNMGYGFAVIAAPKNTNYVLDSLNKYCKAEKIGQVTLDGKVSLLTNESKTRLVL